jgi:hypothetical protein
VTARRLVLLGAALAALTATPAASAQQETRLGVATEVRRIFAPEARQAVAADERHLYVIDNRTIGKYEKVTGTRVGGWAGPADGAIQHLNAGIVRDGRLYSVNSNYPQTPMVSSIEIWDTESMRHVGSHSFGIHSGSATWADLRDGEWWVAFVHYDDRGGVTGRGVEWSTLERFDAQWRRTGGYVFPPRLVERFRPYSNSGGIWTESGMLYLTGHDEPELYVARLPEAGSVLEWIGTIAAPIAGQGIASDPADPRLLYGIERATTEVVEFRISDSP